MGRLIVIEGTDGSGKATQTQLLCEALAQRNIPHQPISFPDYAHPSSALVKMYLGGELGAADSVGAYAASSFYAVDRYASYRRFWGAYYHGGGLVIADRYATSNAIHQMSKLPKAHWPDYLAWLEDYEYGKLELPRPDLVLYLAVPLEVSWGLLSARYDGDEAKRDIHEVDAEYLRGCHSAGLYACEALGWQRVDCCEGGVLKPPGDIAAELLSFVDLFLPPSTG